MVYRAFLLILLASSFLNCSRRLYLDRSQFVLDGEEFPSVDIRKYRSVQERPGQDSSLAVAVAISGGGSRAANLGIGIMLGLENIGFPNGQNALNQVDYLSTVSGGGFAGGAYLSALFDHRFFERKQPFSLHRYVEDHIRKDLGISYVDVLVKGYFNFRTWISFVDYGDALENAINQHVLGLKRRKKQDKNRSILLGDIFIPKDETLIPVRYPMQFANSSAMGTMAIFPFTPSILEKYKVSGYTHQMKKLEKQKLNTYQVPLSVGIKASGSFPVLIPNTTLHSQYHPQRPFLHIMDGAMTDNQGYITAFDVLKQDTCSRKVMLIVDADASGHLYTFSKRQGARAPLKVFISLAASGLYARRATLKKELKEIGEKFGVTPIFLSFHTLIEDIDIPENLPEEIDPKEERQRLLRLLEKHPDALSHVDRHILYELLVNIGTNYSIKPEDQDLLFLSGQYIVDLRREDILKAMGD